MLQNNNNKSMNGHNGHANSDNETNVIRFAPKRPDAKGPKPPPMINLPPVTKLFIAILIAVHTAVFLIGLYSPDLEDLIYSYGGFIPANWSGDIPFHWSTPFTLLTFSFLHGGWLHLGINVLMLAAFGSGVERWLGAKRMLEIFAVSTSCALLAHYLFNMHSAAVVVGISGAISGYFGALILMLKQQNMLGANNSMMPFIIIWLVTAVGFGMMGAPDGGEIAWVAHIGGFLGGLGLTWLMTRKKV